MKRLLVIEPNLRKPSGHYAEFVRALGAVSDGATVEVIAHPEADPMLGLIHGVHVCTDEPRIGSVGAEWRAIMRAVRENTSFLVLTADGRHAMAVSAAAILARKAPSHARLYFHWIPKGVRDPLFMKMSSIAREHALALAPTPAIADALRGLGWRNVECVPYPMLSPDLPPEPAPFSHVMMAGASRANKGLDLVVALAERWESEERSTPLFVQSSMKHALRHGRREAMLIQSLAASGYRGLKTDDQPPERAEYIKRFNGALVLAPYERDHFSNAVSGVVLDALLHGAPVIATRGTWPGSQVERFDAGVTIGERTIDELCIAIDRVLQNWSVYATRACAAARILAREHDPHNLLELITSNSH